MASLAIGLSISKQQGEWPCIPPKKNRKVQQYRYDKNLYKQRHKVENMFGWLKDWRRIAMRYDRCSHTFFSAVCIAASVIFWYNQRVLSLVFGGWGARDRT
ncbi:MAG: transposase [Alphaproteobacteria bacterium]|nr:transposase [Alphaproteobacteria bacterium]